MRFAIAAAIVIASLASPAGAGADDGDDPANSVYVELGGPGLLYSVNYERLLRPDVSLRVGLGAFAIREDGTEKGMTWLTVPITASYLVGQRAHRFEVGGGLATGYAWSDLNQRAGATDDYFLIALAVHAGYRYQPRAGGFLLRALVTPIVGGRRFAPLRMPVTLWAGLSAGWSF